MDGWNFPTVFSGNAISILEGREDVIKDLKLLFNSEMFEFTQDPLYGSAIPTLRFRPKNQLTLDLFVDAMIQAEAFLPNVHFNRSTIKTTFLKGGEVNISVEVRIDLDRGYMTLQLEV
jgi:hypothetical protein